MGVKSGSGIGVHTDFTTLGGAFKLDSACHFGKEGIILTKTYVHSGMEFGPSLSNDNAARVDGLA